MFATMRQAINSPDPMDQQTFIHIYMDVKKLIPHTSDAYHQILCEAIKSNSICIQADIREYLQSTGEGHDLLKYCITCRDTTAVFSCLQLLPNFRHLHAFFEKLCTLADESFLIDLLHDAPFVQFVTTHHVNLVQTLLVQAIKGDQLRVLKRAYELCWQIEFTETNLLSMHNLVKSVDAMSIVCTHQCVPYRAFSIMFCNKSWTRDMFDAFFATHFASIVVEERCIKTICSEYHPRLQYTCIVSFLSTLHKRQNDCDRDLCERICKTIFNVMTPTFAEALSCELDAIVLRVYAEESLLSGMRDVIQMSAFVRHRACKFFNEDLWWRNYTLDTCKKDKLPVWVRSGSLIDVLKHLRDQHESVLCVLLTLPLAGDVVRHVLGDLI